MKASLGYFDVPNLIRPKIKNFKDLKAVVAELPRKKPVLTYCTGDVRCEYLSAYMRSRGFQSVYHLDGGIMKYGKVYGDAGLWRGKCYVFDRRMKIGFSDASVDLAACLACGGKTSETGQLRRLQPPVSRLCGLPIADLPPLPEPDRQQPDGVMEVLERKLAELPPLPGIYYHLDGRQRIIYVGKAANLKARVRQYFQPGAADRADIRARNLRASIRDIQWTVTENALQALFLESEMIKRYQPKYNFLERNVLGESWVYVLIILKGPNPGLRIIRELSGGEEGEILGPYLDGRALRKALRYLRRSFPYSTHKLVPRSACLDYHLGLCPGPGTADFDASAARTDLRRLAACLNGRQSQLLTRLKRGMVRLAKERAYEEAAKTRGPDPGFGELPFEPGL